MAVLQWISHLSLDFVCLQETHVTSLSESSSWFSSNGFSSVVSPGSVHSCGTVILFRPAYYFRDFQTDDSGPFVLAEFQIRESLFRIACVYAPNRNLESWIFLLCFLRHWSVGVGEENLFFTMCHHSEFDQITYVNYQRNDLQNELKFSLGKCFLAT